MKTRSAMPWIAAFALAALAPAAVAQTLYKLIDKNGKVTYAEKPPKDYDGKVIRIDIDPNANTATLPKPKAPDRSGRGESDGPLDAPKKPKVDSVQEARDRLEAARKAYQEAVDNPGPEDVRRVGNVGGGTRPVFSDSYTQRLAALKAAVTKAEEDLRRAEGG